MTDSIFWRWILVNYPWLLSFFVLESAPMPLLKGQNQSGNSLPFFPKPSASWWLTDLLIVVFSLLQACEFIACVLTCPVELFSAVCCDFEMWRMSVGHEKVLAIDAILLIDHSSLYGRNWRFLTPPNIGEKVEFCLFSVRCWHCWCDVFHQCRYCQRVLSIQPSGIKPLGFRLSTEKILVMWGTGRLALLPPRHQIWLLVSLFHVAAQTLSGE